MKLKEMEEIAKHSKKARTRDGSLFERTAMSFFTCRTGRPGEAGKAEMNWAGLKVQVRRRPACLPQQGKTCPEVGGHEWPPYPLLSRALMEATLTLTQNRRVMKETTMRKNRKNMRNQALQCSQLLSPIMRMYSCERETASQSGCYPVCTRLAFPIAPRVPVCLHKCGARIEQESAPGCLCYIA